MKHLSPRARAALIIAAIVLGAGGGTLLAGGVDPRAACIAADPMAKKCADARDGR